MDTHNDQFAEAEEEQRSHQERLLIEAAPDLFAACKAMLRTLDTYNLDFHAMLRAHRQMEAAVAKAQGGSTEEVQFHYITPVTYCDDDLPF